MDSISLKMPVTVKAKLTEKLKEKILKELEDNLAHVDLERARQPRPLGLEGDDHGHHAAHGGPSAAEQLPHPVAPPVPGQSPVPLAPMLRSSWKLKTNPPQATAVYDSRCHIYHPNPNASKIL